MKIERKKPAPKNGEFVVLLHGIMRSKTDMLPMKHYLEKQGYDTLNILYPSRKKNLEDLTNFVEEKIRASKNYNDDKKLHFVTHSMGGLLARYYIATRKPKNLSSVVMLGPPNTGSEYADFLTDHKKLAPLFKKIFGPASDQLTTRHKHTDGDITFPLGVIAGNISINPLTLWMMPKKLVGDHDGIVPVERTKIAGMKDHIVVRSTHTFMMFNPRVMRQVAHFLKEQRFIRK
jgi:pimeloyl-ACP methyl ester carboxylesterase